MQFSAVRVAGFKSFVEAAELRIEPGLTGVVGPNGCGKSNILEAIRWVMGEASPRSLRGGGMEDVIFAGTATRPTRQFAEVRLTLDNRARTAPGLWNAEPSIEVVRRIERGLGSAYRINGRDVRQRDVQLLFADAGSGAHSPALVSQGRIGSIVNARPNERRVLLEEAAGIAGLNVRRNDAEIRLRATSANLARLDDVLGQLAGQTALLRRAAKQAERYTVLSEHIRAAEAMLLFARWRGAADAARAAGERTALTEAAVGEATQLAAAATRRAADADAALPELRLAERASAVALVDAQATREGLARELAEVERRLRDLADAEAAVTRDAARETLLDADAAAALARLDGEAATLRDRVAAATRDRPAREREVMMAERDAGARETSLAAAIAAQAGGQAQARAAESARAAATARAARSEADRGRLADELAALDAAGGIDATVPARAAAHAARVALDTAVTDVEAAETARAATALDRDATAAALGAARSRVTALTAEHDAVARLLAGPARAPADAVSGSISVAPGFEAALAAALGDDLDAPLGSGGWAGATVGEDPPLPHGVRPLAEVVSAPAALARRLAQIGVVEDGSPFVLAAGQRLVSPDGRLWRWDGFRAAASRARPAAERLTQRNRLTALAAEIASARPALAVAEQAAKDAAATVATAAAAEATARARRAAAERAQSAAAAELARVEAAAERQSARRADLAANIARLDVDATDHARDIAEAEAALAMAGDLPALAGALTAARAAAETARAVLARARATLDTLVREHAAGVEAIQAIDGERERWSQRAAASAVQTATLATRAAGLAAERAALPPRLAELRAATAGHADIVAAAEAARRTAGDRLAAGEAALRSLDAAARAADAEVAVAREARARAEADAGHAATRVAEAATAVVERFQSSPAALPERVGFVPADLAVESDLAERFESLKAERERMGPVNLRAAIELAEIEASLAASAAERAELDTAVARLRGSIGALNREGRQRLLTAFEKVDAHFRELFGALFAGGQARLELVDADDPLEAGLEIMAQPPGKALASLSLLSGGEQALTAAALIFALFLTNPAPICVLDEVDAPLDDANVERFCDLLDRVSAATDTRFLIVTHNAVTMSRMHRLFGVTMAEPGVSQLVSVDLARAEALLLAAE